MKKIFIYILSFFLVAIISFYSGYKAVSLGYIFKSQAKIEENETQMVKENSTNKQDLEEVSISNDDLNNSIVDSTNSIINSTQDSLTENDDQNIVTEDEKVVTVDTIKEEKITPETRIIMQYYYLKDNKLIEEIINPPYYFLNLSRDKLINYIVNYNKNPDTIDNNKKLISFELVSFSSTEVILKKVFNLQYEKEVIDYYQVYYEEENNKIIVKNPDGSIRDEIYIPPTSLHEEDKALLKKPGLKIYDEKDLLELLENYTS